MRIMGRTNNRRSGSSLLEFVFVGVPTLFLIISALEMSLTMWQYHTLAEAVQVGARYVVTHGGTCNCNVTVAEIATVVKNAAVGLPAANVNLTLTPATGAPITCTVATCISGGSGSTQFPASGTANAAGSTVTIAATYMITNPLVMYWPGKARVSGGNYLLGAQSVQEIMY